MIGIDEEKTNIDELLCNETMYIDLTEKEKNAITEWFIKGTNKGYICGPFDIDFKFPFKLHISPLFVVPKPLKDEYRPIGHLSYVKYPWQYSVNDIIDEKMKHVKYIQFKEIVQMMDNAGKNAFMWTIDAQDAYYRIPINKKEYKYMGLKWHNKLWLFLSLQMGLASAPKIYTRFGDAVEYIIVKHNINDAFIKGVQSIRHYLDDSFGVGKNKRQAEHMFNETLKWLEILNIPTRPHKCKHANQILKILGWIFNSIYMRCELPKKKKQKAIARLTALLINKKCTKKQMEQLIGILQHISLIIFPGKTFVRRFEILVYKQFVDYNDVIEVDEWVLEDVQWWLDILQHQKHVRATYKYLLKSPSSITHHIYTDAASTIGAGGILNNLTYQIRWVDTILDKLIEKRGAFDIHAQEMLGALIAVKLWAPLLSGGCVALYNDNPGAAGAIITKAPPLYRLDMQFMIRELSKLAATYKFYFWGIKVNGNENDQADALSRFYDLKQFNLDSTKCKMVKSKLVQSVVNQYMQKMIDYRNNVDPSIKRWDMNALKQLNKRRNERKNRKRNEYKFTHVQSLIDYC